MFSTGDAFQIVNPRHDNHLWVIISDLESNPNKFLMVNFTTYENYKDDSCIIEAGEHPFVIHKTCVNYHDALLVETKKFERLLRINGLKGHDPVSDDVLNRIREGADKSKKLAEDERSFLRNQGLVG